MLEEFHTVLREQVLSHMSTPPSQFIVSFHFQPVSCCDNTHLHWQSDQNGSFIDNKCFTRVEVIFLIIWYNRPQRKYTNFKVSTYSISVNINCVFMTYILKNFIKISFIKFNLIVCCHDKKLGFLYMKFTGHLAYILGISCSRNTVFKHFSFVDNLVFFHIHLRFWNNKNWVDVL